MHSYGIKHQIEASISASERNIETLRQLQDLYQKLEPSGWTPDIYASAVAELQRVQMCVVHRSVINDVFALARQVQDELPNHIPGRMEYGADSTDFTVQDLARLRDALQQSLAGLPPK